MSNSKNAHVPCSWWTYNLEGQISYISCYVSTPRKINKYYKSSISPSDKGKHWDLERLDRGVLFSSQDFNGRQNQKQRVEGV